MLELIDPFARVDIDNLNSPVVFLAKHQALHPRAYIEDLGVLVSTAGQNIFCCAQSARSGQVSGSDPAILEPYDPRGAGSGALGENGR